MSGEELTRGAALFGLSLNNEDPALERGPGGPPMEEPTAEGIVREVVRIGAPLTEDDICVWCEECPDEEAEGIAEAGGAPVYVQAPWHAPDCPWRRAHELLDGHGPPQAPCRHPSGF
jgi:hypothetical protein